MIGVQSAMPFLRRWRSHWSGYACALGAVALVSVFIGLVLGQVNLANVSMLYLLAVMATAVLLRPRPSHLRLDRRLPGVRLVLCRAAPPVHGQRPGGVGVAAAFPADGDGHRPAGGGSAPASARGTTARARGGRAVRRRPPARREATSIPPSQRSPSGCAANCTWTALAVEVWRPQGETPGASAPATASALQDLHGRGAGAARVHAARTGPVDGPARRARSLGAHRSADARVAARATTCIWCRCESATAALARCCSPTTRARFAGSEDRLLSAAAAQIGLAVERERLRQEATEAEILRRTDQLRATLLNAVSHDLRTPLATIMASAGSLRQHDVAVDRRGARGLRAGDRGGGRPPESPGRQPARHLAHRRRQSEAADELARPRIADRRRGRPTATRDRDGTASRSRCPTTCRPCGSIRSRSARCSTTWSKMRPNTPRPTPRSPSTRGVMAVLCASRFRIAGLASRVTPCRTCSIRSIG